MDRQLIVGFFVFLVCASIYADDVLPPPAKYPYYRRANRSTCAFPFVYEGKTYHDCTTDGDISADFPWCSLHPDYQGAVTYCHDFRNADLQCLPSFTVNGKQYTSCDYIPKTATYKTCQSNSTAIKFPICVQEHIPTRGKPTFLPGSQCDSSYSKLSVNHTMCMQPSDSALPVALTDVDITNLLAIHNQYRSEVNAKFMMKLYWDNELAKIAQAHANMCAFEHDIAPNRVSPLYGWFHGQNMVMITDITTPPATLADIMFSSEQARFTYGVACTAANSCSHYTQLMLAGMTRMGCGQTHCLYPHGYERFLVCNYIHSQYDDTAVKPYEEVDSQAGNICPASKLNGTLCDCGNVVCGDDTVAIQLPGCTCPSSTGKRSINKRDATNRTLPKNHKPVVIPSKDNNSNRNAPGKRDLNAIKRHGLVKRNLLTKVQKVD